MSNLSKENINKLCMTGVYNCDPVLSWLPTYKRNTPYHCCNWTFKVFEYDGEYYMVDTYWAGGGMRVTLDDDNFDKFDLICDLSEYEEYRGSNFSDYDDDDKIELAMDSSGVWKKSKYIKKGATPNKDRVIARLKDEIDSLKRRALSMENTLARVMNDELDIRYV